MENGSMRVTILGSGTCAPSLERCPCSILVQIDHKNILVDAGPGIMGQLLKVGVQINDLDLILLSHFHLDHCAEIAPLLFALKYSGLKQKKHLTLAGGKGIKQWFNQLNQAHGHSIDMPKAVFSILELGNKGSLDRSQMNTLLNKKTENDLFSVMIDYARVEHKQESRAFRFTDGFGFSLVYSGDTDVSESLVKLSDSADVLICESSFPDVKKVPGHLTPSLAGEMAARAGVKQLVLTHLYPDCESIDLEAQCCKKFNGQILLAKDLFRISS